MGDDRASTRVELAGAGEGAFSEVLVHHVEGPVEPLVVLPARREEWGPFLEAAGVSARVARDMMSLSRAGMTPERLTELGGVRAALESLRISAAFAVEAAADAAEDGDGRRFLSG